jgi:6-phosphofructokinase 1
MNQQPDLKVATLGAPRFDSPLEFGSASQSHDACFVDDDVRIRYAIETPSEASGADELSYEAAGPRRRIYFDPAKTSAAIVTCGGLSPGLNNVIRSLYYALSKNYGVPRVLGIRRGYLGLNRESGLEPIVLDQQFVEPIDKLGGTALGTSRGPQDAAVMVDFLQARRIDLLFCIGGDGTQRGALAIHEEAQRRKLPIAVVGIPKTIDNDIPFVRLAFGYTTALEKAAEVICGAHVEAHSAINGIGLVKLMGRHAGFIAAGASVVSQEVNFTLIPEVPFPLEGEDGFLAALEQRMRAREHAVIVVAEGAGQHLFADQAQRKDASGNVLCLDIAGLLREKIHAYFDELRIPITMKYLDPSYFIRSVPANAYDRFLCDQLARNAVHAALAGKSGILIGQEHNRFIHVPIAALIGRTKRLDVNGDLWRSVLQGTGQPRW